MTDRSGTRIRRLLLSTGRWCARRRGALDLIATMRKDEPIERQGVDGAESRHSHHVEEWIFKADGSFEIAHGDVFNVEYETGMVYETSTRIFSIESSAFGRFVATRGNDAE